jgi:hypothetical protein
MYVICYSGIMNQFSALLSYCNDRTMIGNTSYINNGEISPPVLHRSVASLHLYVFFTL